jgi:hypothetical protein
MKVFKAWILIFVCAVTLQAQSGRRQPKTTPAPPVPTPTPEPTPTPKKEKEAEFAFFVGADSHLSYGSIPLFYYDAAMRGCAERLRKGSSADVDITQKDLSRGEGIKKAKSESKTYVVVLTLAFDSMSRSYDDLQLEFVVFAPTTAKVVITGRSYLRGARAGPVVVGPTSRGSTIYREQLLRQAGEDAASRILKAVYR